MHAVPVADEVNQGGAGDHGHHHTKLMGSMPSGVGSMANTAAVAAAAASAIRATSDQAAARQAHSKAAAEVTGERPAVQAAAQRSRPFDFERDIGSKIADYDEEDEDDDLGSRSGSEQSDEDGPEGSQHSDREQNRGSADNDAGPGGLSRRKSSSSAGFDSVTRMRRPSHRPQAGWWAQLRWASMTMLQATWFEYTMIAVIVLNAIAMALQW